MSSITAVLVHSPTPQTGKTTFVEHLVERRITNATSASFAIPIKVLAHELYKGQQELIGKACMTFEEFAQTKKDIIIPGTQVTPRDMTIDISQLLQSWYSPSIWGEVGYTVCKNLNKEGTCVFVFDDYRRPTESDYLRSQPDVKVITVWLERKGLDTKGSTLSSTSQSYEGLLKKEDFDVHLTLEEDWSNTDSLLDTLVQALSNN